MMACDMPPIVKRIDFRHIQRIDVALEGDWSATVACVWRRREGFLGFSKVIRKHQHLKPSIELYFIDRWIGIHCYKESGDMNVFDEDLAMSIIAFIDSKLLQK